MNRVADNEGYSPEIQCQLDSLLQSEVIFFDDEKRGLKKKRISFDSIGNSQKKGFFLVFRS